MYSIMSSLSRQICQLLLLAGATLLLSGQGRPAAPTAILVSIEQRHLWYVSGRDVIFDAPVAVGISEDFVFDGKRYDFDTPRGVRRILKKETDPVWTVPLWHYYEKAANKGLEVIHIETGKVYALGDDTHIQVRENQVGRVNRFGNFWPFTPGIEIIFDNKIYVPPMGTAQRQVSDVLGPFKLDMGEGYLIHGTHEDNEDSIGEAVSHGCIRMHNHDLKILYDMVAVGTTVYIN